MKKAIKTILIILNFVFNLIFFCSCFLNPNITTLFFILAIITSIFTQIICLDKFKFGKRLLFLLLSILLTTITTLIGFFFSGLIFPYTSDINISFATAIVGLLFIFINFTIFYTYLMVFVNKLKEKEKAKSSFAKLLIFYPLIIIILETLIMILCNQA